MSPVRAATDSVAWLNSAANGTMAATESTNRRVWASGLAICSEENHRHQRQQPQQRIAPYLSHQRRSRRPLPSASEPAQWSHVRGLLRK